MSEDLIQAPAATDKPKCDHLVTEFAPDWRLDATGILTVALSLSLSKHIPDWPGATDEQLAAVAGDTAGAAIAELKELTRLNRMFSNELKKSTTPAATDKPSGDHPGAEFEAKARNLVQEHFGYGRNVCINPFEPRFQSAIASALAEAVIAERNACAAKWDEYRAANLGIDARRAQTGADMAELVRSRGDVK